jgi:hypothetical protein
MTSAVPFDDVQSARRCTPDPGAPDLHDGVAEPWGELRAGDTLVSAATRMTGAFVR